MIVYALGSGLFEPSFGGLLSSAAGPKEQGRVQVNAINNTHPWPNFCRVSLSKESQFSVDYLRCFLSSWRDSSIAI
jgi:hypothetical protein